MPRRGALRINGFALRADVRISVHGRAQRAQERATQVPYCCFDSCTCALELNRGETGQAAGQGRFRG